MTHPIVETAERAFMGYDRGDIYDQAGEPIAVDERTRDAILAALREMRKPATIGRLTPWNLPPDIECPAVQTMIRGYLDAVIREIEA